MKPGMLCPKAVEKHGDEYKGSEFYESLMSHNEIPAVRTRWFRKTYWMVCIDCDNWRQV